MVQDVKGAMSRDAREMSGDDSCPFGGTLVGASAFKTARFELDKTSDNKLPLLSCMLENQRGSCALKSPRTRVSASSRRWSMLTCSVT